MRFTGTLFTILALVAVQAPWIACACNGDGSLVPVVAGLMHGDADHDHEHDHAGHQHPGHCCDHAAHLAHGANHRHGTHCHGTFAHDHDAPSDEAPTRHDGFSLPFASMPADVTLDAPQVLAPIFTTLDDAATWHVAMSATIVRDAKPPERRLEPSVVTERLLL